ncbi:MAG: hypothetical protein DBY05_05125 [Clostridiales bacterium]|nr:MAG: hypothetical protein DBY05_05125 [Clostridiales bacterium]
MRRHTVRFGDIIILHLKQKVNGDAPQIEDRESLLKLFFVKIVKTDANQLTGNRLFVIIAKQDFGGVAQLVRALP